MKVDNIFVTFLSEGLGHERKKESKNNWLDAKPVSALNLWMIEINQNPKTYNHWTGAKWNAHSEC